MSWLSICLSTSVCSGLGSECYGALETGDAPTERKPIPTTPADSRTDQLESEAIEAGVQGLGEKKKE